MAKKDNIKLLGKRVIIGVKNIEMTMVNWWFHLNIMRV